MASSPQLDHVIGIMKDIRSNRPADIHEARAVLDQAFSVYPPASDVTIFEIDAGGVPCQWITAPGVPQDRLIIYLHGGAYATCSPTTHKDLISRLSLASGAAALGVDYRLAPEYLFPAAVEDCLAAYNWALGHGFEPGNIVLAGDSAGGGLVVSVLLAARDSALPLPAGGVCFSPWVDLECTGDSMSVNDHLDAFIKYEGLFARAQSYLGEADPKHPWASALYADLHGLPPLLIHVGSAETLLDDSTRLAILAKDSGVDVSLKIWDDMVHVWQLFASVLPEGQQSIDESGEFIRSKLG
ncbi:MAG: alpha/beta hydrolase [Dehalococcoidia bacterium]|nr:alpha/beta hydrolase [Dehalococcoidia bacterium]